MQVVIFYFMVCILTLISESNEISEDFSPCPLWHKKDGNNGDCICGKSLNGVVKCHPEPPVVSVKSCYCMTMDDESMKPVVAPCLYTCGKLTEFKGEVVKFVGTYSVEAFNNITCGRYNRRGLLCSKCIIGYGLPVHSYSLSCVPCKDYRYNWLKYIALVYSPLTVLVFAIIFFRFSANSASLTVYITACQVLSNRYTTTWYLLVNPNLSSNIFVAFYSVWNLDVSRSLNFNFCLHPQLNEFQVLMLDYLAAVYPLLLIILAYLIIHFHGQSRTFAKVLKPLWMCTYLFRKKWNIQNSFIEAFASLIMLSFVKILHLTFEMTSYIFCTDMNSDRGRRLTRAYPSAEYFSFQHLPSIFVAVSGSLVFNFLPVLILFFYPYKATQRFLNYAGLNSRVLHTFMDAFHGGYKFEPNFLRSFSIVSFFVNTSSLLLYFILDYSFYFTGLNYILLTWLFLLCLCLPYRNDRYNKINIYLVIIFLCLNNGIVSLNYQQPDIINVNWRQLNKYLAAAAVVFFPFYGFCHLMKYFLPSKVKIYLREKWQSVFFKIGVMRKCTNTDSSLYQCHDFGGANPLIKPSQCA